MRYVLVATALAIAGIGGVQPAVGAGGSPHRTPRPTAIRYTAPPGRSTRTARIPTRDVQLDSVSVAETMLWSGSENGDLTYLYGAGVTIRVDTRTRRRLIVRVANADDASKHVVIVFHPLR